MGDSEGPNPKPIPSWQVKDATISDSTEGNASQPAADNATPDPREPLLRQATKFLEDENIRDAPIERKRVFLLSKGLTEDEISDFLQEKQEEMEHAPKAEVMEDYGIDKEEVRRLQSSRRTSSAVEQKPPSSLPEDPPRPPQDIPPIITYPEFLIYSQKPPPLITARRLLTTLYVASGAAATLYGTSKYIVEPMIESLTAARHSLSKTASSNLNTLNLKLESAVSKIPVAPLLPDDDGSDVESLDSDPARFFNRSAATQTSPRLSRSTSSASSESIQPASPSQLQEISVTEIYNRLADIQPTDATSLVKTSITDLRKYLDGLPSTNSPRNGKPWEKSRPDEYTKLKAEIRGVKGVVLSARNFPSSATVR